METKKERKEGGNSGKRKGTSARPQRARVSGDAAATPVPRSGRCSPAQRVRTRDEEATSPARPSLSPRQGAVGAAVPSPGPELRQRPPASSEGADCAALGALGWPALTPPPPGGAAPGRRRPDAGRPRRLPEAGRVLQTLFEIHRHLHPASASPRRRRSKGRGSRGSGCAGDGQRRRAHGRD